jgi:uncharacterized protein YdeI (YjbR/CyaY-like superfamily)
VTGPRRGAPAPRFFATPAAFRRWLERHHASAGELWVGFHKRGSGRASITWPESVAEALCFGWIDGVRKRLDEHSYVIRFTPRRPGSNWSAVNVAKMEELLRDGRVAPAGARAYAARSPAKTGIYAYEQRASAALDAAAQERFRADPAAWEYFQSQAPGYRRIATWWVVSAKRPETRQRRLASLIEASARRRRVGVIPKDKPGE